jgi:DNA-binding LacI/PurR family transcriptional regulator
MRVSLVEVAARAGVSPGTVSHVLNGNAAARIAPATQERIRRIAEEMGYRPNIFARRLLGKQTKTLGLLIAGLENPFFAGIARALEQTVRAAGYQVLLYATMTEPWVYPEYNGASSWPVDGVLVWSRSEVDMVRVLGAQAHALPMVYLGYEGAGAIDYATFDLYTGARKLMEYLIGRDYRRIAYVRPEGVAGGPPSESRARAYAEVCAEANLRPETLLLDTGPSAQMAGVRLGQAMGARPRSERPDALFCYNDSIAIGVYHGLLRTGLRTPEDIAVTGFDGVEPGQCLDRPLTTVLSPSEPLAAAAVDILLRRLSGDHAAKPEGVVIPTTLVVGQTTR